VFVPYVAVDILDYAPSAPWPSEPAGTGPSLQRLNPAAFGNDPINWAKSSTNGGSPGTAEVLIPAAPTNLSATTFNYSQINLAWVDNASNETSFVIQRSLDGINNWTNLPPQGANVVSYSDIGLSPATQYYYRVYAANTY